MEKILKQKMIEIRAEAEKKRDKQHMQQLPFFIIGAVFYFSTMYFYYL